MVKCLFDGMVCDIRIETLNIVTVLIFEKFRELQVPRFRCGRVMKVRKIYFHLSDN